MTNINENITNNLHRIATAKAKVAADKQLMLEGYLEFGRELSQLAKENPSTKIRGQIIAERYPDSKHLDAALRTNCKWLYEALHDNDHEAANILTVLRVGSIHDLGSECPTVIRRLYLKAKGQ